MQMDFLARLRSCALSVVLVAAAAVSTAGGAAAQTPVRVTLDFKFEGPSAPFFVGLDKGYYKAEGLDVTIDPAAGSLEPINRVASGDLRHGLRRHQRADQFRDPNPANADQGRVHGVQQAAIRDRQPQEPRRGQAQGSRRQEARRALADGAFAQWKIFVKANASTPER